MATVLRRLRDWFLHANTLQKAFFILATAAVLIVIAETVFFLVIGYQSLQTGLTIYLSPDAQTLSVAHGQNTTLSFSLGARDAPLCVATCDWRVTDLTTRTTVRHGTLTPRSNPQTLGTTIGARGNSTGTDAYQIVVECRNTQALRCQRKNETQDASATVLVTTTYSPAERAAADAYAMKAPGAFANMAKDAGALLPVTHVNDPRAATVRADAERQAAMISALAENITAAVRADDPVTAERLLTEGTSVDAASAYERLVVEERNATRPYDELLARNDTIAGLLAAGDAPTGALATARTAWGDFPDASPASSAEAFSGALRAVDAANQTPSILLADQGSALLRGDLLAACTLKSTTCPASMQNVTDAAQAAQRLRSVCDALSSLGATYSAAQAAFARQLVPNATLQEALNATGAQALRQSAGWNATQAAIIRQARRGVLSTTNDTVRLAVELAPSDNATAFLADSCPVPDTHLPPPLTPTLQPATPIPVSFTAPTLPSAQCCGVDACGICAASTTYPVLLVHGHAFSEDAAPEYSMEAFTPFALAMQGTGRLYVGNVFPSDTPTSGPYSTIPGGVSATTTYYYDSYAEQGKTVLVAQKTENIETYAIRLKQAIDNLKAETGQPKVVLVAHSMGGLVARSYLDIFGSDSVAGLVMIGTPNHGINGTAAQVCPIVGGQAECSEMLQGSLFLRKLNSDPQPHIPMLTVTGTGCDGRAYDGVVEASSVSLPGVPDSVVHGACHGTHLLHTALIDPSQHPEVLHVVESFVENVSHAQR